MMNRDKLFGAIGSSLIGVGSAVILYSISYLKKKKEEEVIQDGIGIEEEELETVDESEPETPDTAE
jgi:hypothetical protein